MRLIGKVSALKSTWTVLPGAAVSLRNGKGFPSNLAGLGNTFFASMGLKMMLDYRGRPMTFFGDCR